MWIFNVIPLILQIMASVITDWVFWLVVVLVAYQYRRMANMRESLLGDQGESILQATAVSLVYGLIGGFLGSIALISVGISINEIGLAYLWPLAVLLMLINIRFLCFSYAGGLVSLSNLIFGFPKVEVPQLIALVGLLHLIEAALIYANGYHDAIPVHTKTAEGKVVGGYIMQKLWPIPFVVLVIISLSNPDYSKNGVAMPDWWPLIKSGIYSAKDKIQYVPFAVAAALGYGDVTVTSLPKEKTRISALYLLIYSLILILLSVLASRIAIFMWIAALFSPIGHEFVIKLGKDIETKGMALFTKEQTGIRILDVLPETPAAKAGLTRGDLILSVNGINVNSKQDFAMAVAEMPWFVEINYMPYRTGITKQQSIRKTIPESLGVILPPEPWENPTVELEQRMLFKNFLHKIFGR